MSLRTLLEGELEKAETTLAARNLVDEIQDTLQHISKLQVEDLAALQESMRANLDQETADTFFQTASQALQTLVDALGQAKSELDSAVLVATGEAPAAAPLGSDDGLDASDGLDLDGEESGLDDLEAPAVDDAAAGGEDPVGRGVRDEVKEHLRKQIQALERKLKESRQTRRGKK